MRRTALLLLTAFFPLLSIQVNAQTKKGDLNGDGNVGKEDVTCLIYKILGLAEGNEAYDVNEDGKTDIADVTCLIGIIASNQQGMPFQTCPDDHHPHMIDLGLPSGVKWACCNVGASKPENYGGYYAWGETEVKNDYSFETYIHCDGTQETCHYLGNITGTAYDVAHVKWGEAWRMPTIAERDELIRNCSVETVTLYDKFFDKYTGPNGSFIIIPYGGNMYSSINLHEGSDVHSWTSEPLENGQSAHYLYKNGLIGSCLTCMGLTVRPVYDPSFFFSLSEETVDVFVNSTTSVSIEMGSGEYELQYDQTDIIDAELIMADKEEYPDAKDEISIYGVAEGTATLSVLDKQNNKTATLVVNVKTPTEEDIATTMEYIARVRNYINSLGEISVDVFQSNLLSWLDEQNWVKKVSTYSDDLVTNTSPNGARNLIRGLNDIVGLIKITFENNVIFSILFDDSASDYTDKYFSDLQSYLTLSRSIDVSSIVGEEIIESTNVLYIQGRTMPNFNEQNKSTAVKEGNMIQKAKELSPIDFKITTVSKSLSFLDIGKTKLEDYNMILLGQTHGMYFPMVCSINNHSELDSYGLNHSGSFEVEDQYTTKELNCGITLAIDKNLILESKDEPNIYRVSPVLMGKRNIKDNTIFFGSYCHSYFMQEHIPNTTFFGYKTKENYYEGSAQMAEFFYNMSLGMTYKDAIENKDPITKKPNPLYKEYDYTNGEGKERHVVPATNRPESKQRYFSISTEDVTEFSTNGRPIFKGKIEGYENLKKNGKYNNNIQYYAYVLEEDEEFNPDLIGTGVYNNNKLCRLTINDDGTFSYVNQTLPLSYEPKTYKMFICINYKNNYTNNYFYGELKTFTTPEYKITINEAYYDLFDRQFVVSGQISGYEYSPAQMPYWALISKNDEDYDFSIQGCAGVVEVNEDGSFTCNYPYLSVLSQDMKILIRAGAGAFTCEAKNIAVPGMCPDEKHPHMIDLGFGTKWACCDVGSNNPSSDGELYGYWDYWHPLFGESFTLNSICGTNYDVAHVLWGSPWQMPSSSDYINLKNNCNIKYLGNCGYFVNGEFTNGIGDGWMVVGPNGNAIFFSYLGDYPGHAGSYWTGTTTGTGSSSNLFHFAFEKCEISYFRCEKAVVRPIAK